MLHRRLDRGTRPRSASRILSSALAVLLAGASLVAAATPAQAAPPAAPTFEYTMSKQGATVDFGANLEPGSQITAVSTLNGNAQATIVPPTSIAFTSSGSASYPKYTFPAQVQYTVENGGESSTGLINLTVVQKPWLTAYPSTATLKRGATATLKVNATGWGFDNGAESGGHYSVKSPGPAVGTAQVASDGTVTYTAPADAAYGTYTFNVVATDGFGQESELYTPLSVTVASAEADRIGLDVPYESAAPGTRVDILPDHARGVNPRVTNVTANINNAAVSFDATGATFTPPAGYSWGADQTSYIFAAPYTVTDDNGSVSSQIDVRVLRRPLVSVDTPTQYVGVGKSATATVSVANYPVIPTSGGYSIDIPPTAGSATVSDAGVVTFDATGATIGETYPVRVRVTDKVQQSETIDAAFTVYDGAFAPDLDKAEQADASFAVDLLAGAGGEGKHLTAVTVTAGDATVAADLAAGTVEVTPTHAWADGEAEHPVELGYTIADDKGGTDTGTVAALVLRAPEFAHTGAGEVSKRATVGDIVHFSATVEHPETLPAAGAYAVAKQPATGSGAGAGIAGASASGPVTVDDAGRVTFDTAGLTPGETYAFEIAATDLVGQTTTQTFRLTLNAAGKPGDNGGDDGDDGDRGGREGGDDLPGTGSEPVTGPLAAGAVLLILAAGAVTVLGLRRRAR